MFSPSSFFAIPFLISLSTSCNQVKVCPLFLSAIPFYSLLSLSCQQSICPSCQAVWRCLWFHVTPGYSHHLQLLHPRFLTDTPSFCLDAIHTYLNHPQAFGFSLAALPDGRSAPHPRAAEDNPIQLTLPARCLTGHPSLQLPALPFPHSYALLLPSQNPCGPRQLLPAVPSPVCPVPPPAPAFGASSCVLSADALSCAFLFALKPQLKLRCLIFSAPISFVKPTVIMRYTKAFQAKNVAKWFLRTADVCLFIFA